MLCAIIRYSFPLVGAVVIDVRSFVVVHRPMAGCFDPLAQPCLLLIRRCMYSVCCLWLRDSSGGRESLKAQSLSRRSSCSVICTWHDPDVPVVGVKLCAVINHRPLSLVVITADSETDWAVRDHRTFVGVNIVGDGCHRCIASRLMVAILAIPALLLLVPTLGRVST